MNFEKYVQESNEFLKEVANELNNGGDTNHAYRVLRTVFHTLREILTTEESLHMIAQLPMLLKAVYVEGWKPATKKKPRSMGEFLECLRANDKQAAHKTDSLFCASFAFFFFCA